MTTFAFDIENNTVTFLKDAAAGEAWEAKHVGYIVTKWEDLYEITGHQLATLHNVAARELNKARPSTLHVADVARFATKGAAEDRIKRLIADLFELRGGAAQFQVAAKPKAKPAAAEKAPKTPTPARRNTGITLAPKATVYACREGSKQATLVDMLSRPQGATMSELLDALSGGGKPWLEVTVKSGLNWDMNKIKGYGIRTTKRGDLDCYHLVLPEGMAAPVPHTPRKDAASDLVKRIKEWATNNYAKSYGASALLETLTDAEMAEQFKSLKDARDWAKTMDEAHQNAQG